MRDPRRCCEWKSCPNAYESYVQVQHRGREIWALWVCASHQRSALDQAVKLLEQRPELKGATVGWIDLMNW